MRAGRTGCINDEGLATFFSTDGDEAITSALVALLETNQHIHEFLHSFFPEIYRRYQREV